MDSSARVGCRLSSRFDVLCFYEAFKLTVVLNMIEPGGIPVSSTSLINEAFSFYYLFFLAEFCTEKPESKYSLIL